MVLFPLLCTRNRRLEEKKGDEEEDAIRIQFAVRRIDREREEVGYVQGGGGVFFDKIVGLV